MESRERAEFLAHAYGPDWDKVRKVLKGGEEDVLPRADSMMVLTMASSAMGLGAAMGHD